MGPDYLEIPLLFTSHATFGKMLFELWASVGPAGPQFKQHCHKRREGRRAGNRFGVFRALRDCPREDAHDVRFFTLLNIF